MPTPLKNVQVITVRYGSDNPAKGDSKSIDAYAKANAYDHKDITISVTEPTFPEDQRTDSKPTNLGLLGDQIANAVANARQNNQGVMMTGGDCAHITGVVGGLQDAHGPDTRIGLVWFDAHGDFNTPNTSLSGMLGGMPVAVCAGLAFPEWREGSHIKAALPTDRIVMVDVRNLDPPEEQLIRATDIVIASPARGFPGEDLQKSITDLADRCDMIYLHIDSDILDISLVPNHGTGEPDGPDMAQVQAAIETVMATGKVAAFAVVSVYGEGEGSEISVASGIQLIQTGLTAWQKYGMPELYPHHNDT